MSTRMVRHIVSSNSIPLYAIVAASLISLSLLVIHMIGMDLWKVALLILLAWLPIVTVKTREIYRQYHWLAFFFVLLIAQSVHFTEHIAQMIQIHLLGLSGMQAHGIVGSPGLLAHGGFIAGGLPLIRPDLHFLYNLIEETLIMIAYTYQLKHLSGSKESNMHLRGSM